jgi:cytochrome P450
MASTESDRPESVGCPAGGYESVDLSEATLADPQILARPNAFYRAMRREDPVHYDSSIGMYLVSRFEDLQTVLRDPISFSVAEGFKKTYAKGFFDEFREILEREGGGFFPDAIMSDPPYHTRIRRLLEKAFTARRVKLLEPGITALVVEMIEGLVENGEADVVAEFAVPLTSAVICEQLGFGRMPSETIHRWSHAVAQQISQMQSREEMHRNAKTVCELQNFLIAQIRDREKNPREDITSDLVHARTEEDAEPALTFEETVSLVRAVLVAGNDTTTTALGNLFFILATRPAVADLLRSSADDDRFLTRFVEELLRIEPPVRGLSRMTTREVELSGTTLPAGAHMLLLYAAANDDETEFACPREFDMERKNLGRQVAFGGGVHRCVGATLARMEIKIAAREIARRMDDIKLALPVEEIAYLPTLATRAMKRLPVTFTRRR